MISFVVIRRARCSTSFRRSADEAAQYKSEHESLNDADKETAANKLVQATRTAILAASPPFTLHFHRPVLLKAVPSDKIREGEGGFLLDVDDDADQLLGAIDLIPETTTIETFSSTGHDEATHDALRVVGIDGYVVHNLDDPDGEQLYSPPLHTFELRYDASRGGPSIEEWYVSFIRFAYVF